MIDASEPPARTLCELVALRAATDDGAALLQVGDTRRSASELYQRSSGVALPTLRTHGIERGDRVALVADNSIEFIATLAGLRGPRRHPRSYQHRGTRDAVGAHPQ